MTKHIQVFLGGSFDPVHTGHMDMMSAVHARLSVQHCPFYLSFLPTAGNPFKGKPTDPAHRLAMLDLACEVLKIQHISTQVCPLEIHQTPPVYTIDTVRTLTEHYADDEIIFVMGGDSLADLHRWKDYQEILKLVKIWAFARADNPKVAQDDVLAHITDDFEGFLNGEKAIFYDNTPIANVSSTQIRTALAHDDTPAHLPIPILNYIKEHELYKNML